MTEDKLRSLEAKMQKSHKEFEITHSRTMALFTMRFSSFVQNHVGMSITCATLSFPWCMVEEAYTMILSKLELM